MSLLVREPRGRPGAPSAGVSVPASEGIRPLERVLSKLPRGRTLSPRAFDQRHRWLLKLLWAHAVVLPVLALIEGYGIPHTVLHVVPVAACGIIAGRPRFDRRARAVAVSIGLLTSSALLVHTFHGMIEMHFHFFVMISALALYEDWVVFGVALGYVLFHHGVVGALDPHDVYAHSGNPWALAALHGGFVLAASITNIVAWRLTEDVRLALREGSERNRLTLDTAQEAYVAIDEAGKIAGWNREAARLFGWPREEAVGRGFAETVLAPRQRGPDGRALSHFLETRDGRILDRRLELTAVDRQGREFPIEITISALETSEGWRYNAFLHDISERKATETQLLERASQQAVVAEFGQRALEGVPITELMRESAALVAEQLRVEFAAVFQDVPEKQSSSPPRTPAIPTPRRCTPTRAAAPWWARAWRRDIPWWSTTGAPRSASPTPRSCAIWAPGAASACSSPGARAPTARSPPRPRRCAPSPARTSASSRPSPTSSPPPSSAGRARSAPATTRCTTRSPACPTARLVVDRLEHALARNARTGGRSPP